jgi:hypothetical protein
MLFKLTRSNYQRKDERGARARAVVGDAILIYSRAAKPPLHTAVSDDGFVCRKA